MFQLVRNRKWSGAYEQEDFSLPHPAMNDLLWAGNDNHQFFRIIHRPETQTWFCSWYRLLCVKAPAAIKRPMVKP